MIFGAKIVIILETKEYFTYNLVVWRIFIWLFGEFSFDHLALLCLIFLAKTSAQVDYTLSRMVTLSLYYDRQRSEPLLSSSSYPTITQDFGMSMKFSLTR